MTNTRTYQCIIQHKYFSQNYNKPRPSPTFQQVSEDTLQQRQDGTSHYPYHEYPGSYRSIFTQMSHGQCEDSPPHMMEWKSPTAVSNQGLLKMIASKANTPADMVVTVSCTRGETLLNELPTSRPISIPPQ